MITTVDVFPNEGADRALEVRCIAKAGSNKLIFEGPDENITFHALTDAQYRQIVDAIETYLLRKELRDRERAKAGPETAAAGDEK